MKKKKAVDQKNIQISNKNGTIDLPTLAKHLNPEKYLILNDHIYERVYNSNEDEYSLKDVTLEFYPRKNKTPGFTKIELNKLTQPVIDLANKKVRKIKRKAKKNGNTVLLTKLNTYSKQIESMPISSIPIKDKELFLRCLAIRKLHINSEIGAKIIVKAYNEYYKLKVCKQCKKGFHQKKKGRKKQFCSPACRQKYHRRKKQGFLKTNQGRKP